MGGEQAGEGAMRECVTWRTGMCCIRGWTDTTRSGTYESNAAAKWRDTRVPYICGGGSQRGLSGRLGRERGRGHAPRT